MNVSSKGFSLLEVMQSMALAAVSLVGVSSLLLTTVHANTRAQNLTAAATAAQAKIEELRTLAAAEVTDGSDDIVESGVHCQRTWTVTAGPAGSKVVTVRVGGMVPPVELRTIVAD
jgi:prepilin-type N-terminal cleavage/methylation domain-containing protein